MGFSGKRYTIQCRFTETQTWRKIVSYEAVGVNNFIISHILIKNADRAYKDAIIEAMRISITLGIVYSEDSLKIVDSCEVNWKLNIHNFFLIALLKL